MSADKFDWARDLRGSAANATLVKISGAHADEIADELDARQATIDEQFRTIQAMMVGMPEDGTTPVIRRIAALEADLEQARQQRDDALNGPWPEWASVCLAKIREESGYDGYDDPDAGVDLPEELSDLIGEFHRVTDERDSLRARLEAAERHVREIDLAQSYLLSEEMPGGAEGFDVEWGLWQYANAVLKKFAAPVPASVPDVDALTDKIAEMLRGTYHCTRAWSAWGAGTMSEDDFCPVEDSDTPREIAEELAAMLAEIERVDRATVKQAEPEPPHA